MDKSLLPLIPLALLLSSTPVMGHGMKMHKMAAETWAVPASQAERSNPAALSSVALEQGRQLFTQYCSLCHGPSGGGDGKSEATHIAPRISNNTDGELAYKISQGRGQMPNWGSLLNEEQIWSLVTFLRTLTPTTTSSTKDAN